MGSVQVYVEGLHFGRNPLTLAERGKMDVLKINDDDDVCRSYRTSELVKNFHST